MSSGDGSCSSHEWLCKGHDNISINGSITHTGREQATTHGLVSNDLIMATAFKAEHGTDWTVGQPSREQTIGASLTPCG